MPIFPKICTNVFIKTLRQQNLRMDTLSFNLAYRSCVLIKISISY